MRVQGIRLGFKVLELVAPWLGARWALKIWLTVPRVPERSRRPRVTLPLGSPVELSIDGRMIHGTSWGTGPTVYLVHGWAGWGLQLAAFVPLLLEHGFRVVLYDAPSHGDSGPGHLGGRSTNVMEMSEVLTAVVTAQGPAHAIIAHSIGVSAVSQAMLRGLNVRCLVFVSAMKSLDLVVLQRTLGFGSRINAAVYRHYERRFGHTLWQYDLSDVFAAVQAERGLPPLLAFHDVTDRETPYQGSEALVAGWPGSQLQLTDGLGHRKILGDPTILSRAVAFTTQTE